MVGGIGGVAVGVGGSLKQEFMIMVSVGVLAALGLLVHIRRQRHIIELM